jgi:S1-C subfamily serine protease
MRTQGDGAGFQPGDVVTALNDRAVGGIDDLQPLTTQAGAPFNVKVRRGSKDLTVAIDPTLPNTGVARATDTGAGFVFEAPTATFRIDAVLPGSRAARAGVQPGDRLRRINGVAPRTQAQADRVVTGAASKPMLLEIERDRRRIAVVIPEGAAP